MLGMRLSTPLYNLKFVEFSRTYGWDIRNRGSQDKY